jgi:ATP-dependent Lhr-like helicase
MVAEQLLRRTGVVFRKTIAREKMPVSWTRLCRVYRRMELQGNVRGGRFVAGFAGEQFALPQSVELLRLVRREGLGELPTIPAGDPLQSHSFLAMEPTPLGNAIAG